MRFIEALRGGVVALLMMAATASAQDYPSRAIRMVVPFPPGGLIDVLARTIGAKFTEAWAQPVIIDNRPGAAGMLGAEIIAKAPADGYSLLVANTNISINPSLYKALPYDTASAFAPVVIAIFVPNVLVVHEEVPVKSLQELIAFAKAQPGKLNYASASSGSFPHLAVEMFKMLAGVNMTHVPYKGAAPALSAILGKEVEVLSSDIPGALPHLKSGRLKALAVTSVTRATSLPDVLTMAEAGLKEYEAVGWQGIMAPAGTPRSIIEKLNRQVVAALAIPDLQDKLKAQGVEIVGNTPEEFSRFLRSDTARWAKTVAASGARAD